MGRVVIAEDNLLPYLIQLAKSDSYVIGLILGQVRFNISIRWNL
jgi:hypothetical protein